MPSQSTQSPWLKYKRYSDNVKVEARLTTTRGRKFIEIKETRTGNLCCPACGEVLSHMTWENIPNFFLPPAVFHAKYKPIT